MQKTKLIGFLKQLFLLAAFVLIMLNEFIKAPIRNTFWYIGGICLAIAIILFMLEIIKEKRKQQ